jgi:hypothetical protein
MARRLLSPIHILVLALFLLACASLKGDLEVPPRHEQLDRNRMPDCTECHEPRGDGFAYDRFVHTTFFAENHRHAAYQQEQVCAMCHKASFCNDCHATRVELKPSIKNHEESFRRLPHRGDYLSRHRIDGRLDPTSCFRCHGNPKTARTCARCHG